MRHADKAAREQRPVLCRLLASKRGNVLPIVAASILPMTAMIGGAVDMSRAYMVKSRIQQACDAGVLAGRRAMERGSYNDAAKAQAQDFFNINFQEGYNQSTDVVFNTSNASGSSKVVGTASTVMPTAIMGIFGKENIEIGVDCEAELNLSNTDVTFVLDVTGSMKDSISTGDGGSVVKMTSLRSAVMSFYDTLDTAAAGSNARIRYAFAPYSTNVNVGELLYDTNPQWLVGGNVGDTWSYQSRRRVSILFATINQWGKYSYPVHDYLKSIKPSNPEVATPSDHPNNKIPSRWKGCIEERETIGQSNIAYASGSITVNGSSNAYDLDIDRAPFNETTKWRPYWEEVYYLKNDTQRLKDNPRGLTACPAKASLLASMSRTQVQTYVDSLFPVGGTYHDVGLLWGARIASPQGLFASVVNAAPGNSGTVGRHLIFMTDGDLTAYPDVASMYGIEQYDTRLGAGTNTTEHLERRRQRYLAICEAIKGKGIRLWVIAFGTTLTDDLTTCASTGSSFTAENSVKLNAAFQNIAKQISELRLTK